MKAETVMKTEPIHSEVRQNADSESYLQLDIDEAENTFFVENQLSAIKNSFASDNRSQHTDWPVRIADAGQIVVPVPKEQQVV